MCDMSAYQSGRLYRMVRQGRGYPASGRSLQFPGEVTPCLFAGFG